MTNKSNTALGDLLQKYDNYQSVTNQDIQYITNETQTKLDNMFKKTNNTPKPDTNKLALSYTMLKLIQLDGD
jgi:hypothetical protein